MFTENGIASWKDAKKNYPKLYNYYDPYMGNFGMTDSEMVDCTDEIFEYLKNHREYVLLYQDGYENGKCWWLTTEY